MIGSIIYRSVNAEYWESSKNTGLSCFLDTFTDCRNVFLRNCTTNYGRFK